MNLTASDVIDTNETVVFYKKQKRDAYNQRFVTVFVLSENKKRGYINMNYPFVCPKCGKNKNVEMSMKEYHSDGHFCECGEEMVREVKSLVCACSINKCGGFYRKIN